MAARENGVNAALTKAAGLEDKVLVAAPCRCCLGVCVDGGSDMIVICVSGDVATNVGADAVVFGFPRARR